MFPYPALIHVFTLVPGEFSLIYPLLWLGVLVVALWLEGATAEMTSIWFAPGALIAMILSFFVYDIRIQLIVFAALSAILLVLGKTVLKKFFTARDKIVPTNADALVGQIAVVEEDIDNLNERGVVRVNGQLWTARTATDSDKPVKGEHVTILRVAGSKLICAPRP